jgi:hypothetical protein
VLDIATFNIRGILISSYPFIGSPFHVLSSLHASLSPSLRCSLHQTLLVLYLVLTSAPLSRTGRKAAVSDLFRLPFPIGSLKTITSSIPPTSRKWLLASPMCLLCLLLKASAPVPAPQHKSRLAVSVSMCISRIAARQRLNFRGNEYTCNNRGTVGRGDLHAVRAVWIPVFKKRKREFPLPRYSCFNDRFLFYSDEGGSVLI